MPLVFLKSCLRSPLEMGAILPSSRYLAQAMAEEVGPAECILEVGAGSGAITRGLLSLNRPIVALERDNHLASQLRHRHPEVEVIAKPLEDCSSLLDRLPARTCVVSSLPFRSLPPAVGDALSDVLSRFLSRAPTRKLVQFSYVPQKPFVACHGLRWRLAAHVLRNVPPAFIWTLTQAR